MLMISGKLNIRELIFSKIKISKEVEVKFFLLLRFENLVSF